MYLNIEAERVRNGIERKKMAAALGVSERLYILWVRGLRPIPAGRLRKMAEIYGCDVDLLLTPYEKRRPPRCRTCDN